METEFHAPELESMPADTAESQPNPRLYRWVELCSAVMLAIATVATAWSGYQSARWGGERTEHTTASYSANIRVAKFANLAQQKVNTHVGLFGQWAGAVSTNNQALADFLFERFPEPLKRAATAWRATQPLTNAAAPATPFDMPEYVLAERLEAERWEATVEAESQAAARANDISDRYLLFTIIFAVVLFFGGISGKFRWQALDIAVLIFGALALFIGLIIMILSPVK